MLRLCAIFYIRPVGRAVPKNTTDNGVFTIGKMCYFDGKSLEKLLFQTYAVWKTLIPEIFFVQI
jgi:hypothetical protein